MGCDRFLSCSTALALLVFAAAGGAPLRSFAQGGAGAPAAGGSAKEPSARERALALQAKAGEAFENRQIAEAAELLKAAWDLDKDRALICNRGQILGMMGRDRDAAESLSECLRVMPASEAAVVGKKIERDLKKARERVGTLTIKANVPGAEVVVDGNVVGTTPLAGPVFVEPGNRIIQVRAPGYHPDGQIVPVRRGDRVETLLTLDPMEHAANEGEAASAPTAIPPRAKEAKAPAGKEAAAPPSRPPPQEERAANAERPDQARDLGLLASGLGIAVLGAGLGSGSFIAASGKRQQAEMVNRALLEASGEHACSRVVNIFRCEALAGANADAARLTGLGVGAFVAAAAGGALAVFDIVRDGSAKRSGALHVAVGGAPGGGAVVVTGSF